MAVDDVSAARPEMYLLQGPIFEEATRWALLFLPEFASILSSN
jgi:hypothetical protein